MKTKEFSKIIALKSCTAEEFLKAEKYFALATIPEKRDFLNSINLIVERSFKLMVAKETTDFRAARDEYTKYGLTDAYFYDYFKMFMRRFASQSILDKYKELQKTEKNRMIENIFEMAKKLEWDNLNKIARFYNISVREVNEYLTYYAFHILKFDQKQYTKFKKLCKAYQAFISARNYSFELALEYYKEYANDNEKTIFKLCF